MALVDQPALRMPELDSNDAAALTIAALALSAIRDGNGRRFLSPILSGMTPSRRRTYCLPPSTLSELPDSGGELCA
jgi:hypothetical protein